MRPARAGVFSGRQTRRGKSQSPVAWITGREETNNLKLIDKATLGVVSESPGRSASELTGGLVNLNSGGRALLFRAKAVSGVAGWLTRRTTPAGC